MIFQHLNLSWEKLRESFSQAFTFEPLLPNIGLNKNEILIIVFDLKKS